MLVLSRKVNEQIFAGDIEITVVEIRRGQVRLGITADRDIPVLRGELRHCKDSPTRMAGVMDRQGIMPSTAGSTDAG